MSIRISGNIITELKPSEIFVFGSNEAGIHGAGAAKAALKFGAKYGIGIGFYGQTYAIPTKDKYLNSLSLKSISKYVFDFIQFAAANPDYQFMVTAIGTGLAGFKASEIAPLFQNAASLSNVYLPKEFWAFIKESV